MKRLVTVCAIILVGYFDSAYSVGQFPVPQISDVTFNARIQFTPPAIPTDPSELRFTYQYDLVSGANNIGDISLIFLDIRNSNLRYPQSNLEYSKPLGMVSTNLIMERFERYKSLDSGTIEIVGTDLPEYWNSNPTRDGYLIIATPAGGVLDGNGDETYADLISPGESANNLKVIGVSPPTLREAIIVPDWYLVATEEETEILRDQAIQISRNLQIRVTTIGPKAITPGGYGLHDRLVSDIENMIGLGWINDIALINTIQALLVEIRDLLDSRDGTQAKTRYQQIKDIMSTVTESQMRREAIDLINVATDLQLVYVPDTVIPVEPALINDPDMFELAIGEKVVLNPRAVDTAHDNEPLFFRNWFLLEVLSGPNTGLMLDSILDIPEGEPFGYTSSDIGIDEVQIISPDEDDGYGELSDIVNVVWTGGPDYVISFFSPPYLEYRGDASIFVQDHTLNIGTTAGAKPSITRYYLSSTPTIDLETAYQLTERQVVPLSVNQESESGLTELVWPSQFPPGTYYFAACVDANDEIFELNELNNCSFHSVEKVTYKVSMVGEEISNVNVPPNCDSAVGVPDTLWPPNHKFREIAIEGVVDMDQDSVSIEITSITQDEPVDGDVGSGNTSPDGKGVGTSSASVRAERSGTGDGRVYAINFTATDSVGNQCSGTVTIGAVVHDKGKYGSPANDSGQIYDSTENF